MKRRNSNHQYEDYEREREFLSNIEQNHWHNYEKAILTLSTASLAFSLSFLSLIHKIGSNNTRTFEALQLLVTSWILFGISIFFILFSFVINIVALRKRLNEFELINEGKNDPCESEKWEYAGYAIYGASGLSFMLGVAMMIAFCYENLQNF